MISSCTCKHADQDSFHGRGKRVFNERAKKGGHVCTVCGKEKSGSLGQIKKGKKTK